LSALPESPLPEDAEPMARARTRSSARVAADRIRQDRGLSLLTALAMAVFVVGVYVLIVLGAGTALGTGGSPSLWLSVLATAIVALAFEPVRRSVRQLLARALHQDRVAPYQVLARFPATVTGSYPAAELPARMAGVTRRRDQRRAGGGLADRARPAAAGSTVAGGARTGSGRHAGR